ncbi:hypothetical protein HMPREF9374_1856 [Desmospora sp. 8437]|nr:hypothetical protein HMPREF9374_1856 [Desmospora sp. 8437]
MIRHVGGIQDRGWGLLLRSLTEDMGPGDRMVLKGFYSFFSVEY